MTDPRDRLPERPAEEGADDTVAFAGRSRGETQHLDPSQADWRQQVDWRQRASNRSNRRATAVAGSPQVFQAWLQGGGWRWLLIAFVLFFVIIIFLLFFFRGDSREQGFGTNPPMLDSNSGLSVEPPPLATPEAQLPTAIPQFQTYVVIGTGVEGLFLRTDPSRNNAPITTLPEGTRVEQIGNDVTGSDFVWRPVRTLEGLEGWVAIEFLQPVQ